MRITLTTRVAGAALAAALIGLGAAGPAQADVTATAITAPADRGVVTGDFAVEGTASAASGDQVDLVCAAGTSPSDPYFFLARAVPVAGGRFHVTGPMPDPSDPPAACRLRALPSGQIPSDLAPYKSVRVAFDYAAQPVPWNFHATALQFGGASELYSAGDAGIFATWVSDPATLHESAPVFYGSAALLGGESHQQSRPSTRSELRVDGVDAYLPGALTDFGAGRPPVAFSRTVDGRTGNVRVREEERAVRCASPGYPPTAANCSAYGATGVKLVRTIEQDHDGRLVGVSDTWASTDGHRHSVDLWYDNLFENRTAGFRFPREATFRSHEYGDRSGPGGAIPAPPRGPGVVYVKPELSAPDGDPLYAPGALVFDSAPDGFDFTESARTSFVMRYARTVTPGAPFRLRLALAGAFRLADVAALARPVEDRFGPPSVRITRPRSRAVSTRRVITVRGSARDNVGVRSLRVAGRRVRVDPTGAWSTRVRLRHRVTRIVAEARDAAGNRAVARVRVTYRARRGR